ncbi:hypothetical protein EGR_03417 [Echinococcus granulosus]|uniref:Uncharacterized protein n=1 Tax=Echinococcus granulosus TaxID=6210 RepID=W6UKJ5_ECHGR|nr:hypothetical protein EGR_03417 [Echinococcus granulosus]EUB61603.1 hypothetical protein EGR_03417 [Echinococcus granulosus]
MDKHDDHYIRLFLIQACSQHKTADVAELSRGSSDDAIKHLLACMEFDDWHSWLLRDSLPEQSGLCIHRLAFCVGECDGGFH